ncbi:MAG: hypothetical protein AMJ75_00950 [Phycisphaerae bacterium SM1_79]|nr:MAG: hypothetical protein AMJ75_00950 [Phycisphaerae bacterium SM1_79]
MWIANLVVVAIIAGCATYQYLKGTVVKAFATIIVTICATVVAFGYFEISARLLIRYAPSLTPWAQPLCFALLFILTFAILQTAASQLTRQPTDLGLWPERIGRVVFGVFLGLILSGVLLTALAMAPLSNKYPYQRFDLTNPDAEKPNKVLLNPDGFATGYFSMLSDGSLAAIRDKRSFATLHPALLDQLFLNRHSISDDLPIMTGSEAIEVRKKDAAWYISENITDSDGQPLSPKSGHNLLIVRVGIRKSAAKDARKFTLSQLRLICKPQGYTKKPLIGKGINIYPVGYMKAANQLQKRKLSDQIEIRGTDFGDRLKLIDFAFYVPDGFVPVLVQFKQNNVAEVPPPVPSEQAPEIVPFIESTASKTTADRSSQQRDRPPTTPQKRRGLSDFSRSIVGDQFDDE